MLNFWIRTRAKWQTRRLIALGFATLCASSLLIISFTSESKRKAWGTTKLVWQVQDEIIAGAELDDSYVRAVKVPSALVPDGALVQSPNGRRAKRTLVRNDIVTNLDLAPNGSSETTATLEDNECLVRVPTPFKSVSVTRGDSVEIWSATSNEFGQAFEPGVFVAGGKFVDGDDASATVAINRNDLALITQVMAANSAIIVGLGPTN